MKGSAYFVARPGRHPNKELKEVDYFSEIESTFVRRRGRHLTLGPLDWALIESWESSGIPLKVVLASIEEVFDHFEKDPEKMARVRTLSYCKEAVESRFGTWRDMQVGAPPPASEDGDPEVQGGSSEASNAAESVHIRHISDLLERLEAIRSADGQRAGLLGKQISALEAIRNDPPSREETDRRLEALDAEVEDLLLSEATEEEMQEAEQHADGLLAARKASLGEEEYEAARARIIRKRLRDNSGIPRFGLFYL